METLNFEIRKNNNSYRVIHLIIPRLKWLQASPSMTWLWSVYVVNCIPPTTPLLNLFSPSPKHIIQQPTTPPSIIVAFINRRAARATIHSDRVLSTWTWAGLFRAIINNFYDPSRNLWSQSMGLCRLWNNNSKYMMELGIVRIHTM